MDEVKRQQATDSDILRKTKKIVVYPIILGWYDSSFLPTQVSSAAANTRLDCYRILCFILTHHYTKISVLTSHCQVIAS